ncbi:3-phosphoshikimate 1-carboxyvinyltransferase [Flavobacterium sp. GSP27]|uniref:3-phosphoshikimate 1-carboxyvinyltransferase n=1 Tax=unclassified Flavobacterium TaxID=196869 RepID=UPI000F84C1F1|nr:MULTISPECIES: 3-phosphoshikimate 1-carboxyvinyltransferase [unclassified Flavobacterium]RTY82842.1 3-phosphoshikimate 1-carboxyvinyltransferase [Flavobacterium sp. ZB4P23]RTY89708.1 3-phosphoshikimate 1-carboxyvinyltransferase [Flavobacterium sp. RSP46]RTY93502.1 3-phosphoshikimate 1-carboxyvinyltransferase [Flavobacterium sp. GSN2]RTZ08372.1 3-phosphoshikimate 1-carboxyvinyltransferase [Flavobacterium sp. GSP27]
MNLLLQTSQSNLQAQIAVTGSKSETNRLLLLQALFPNITLANTSNSDDSEVMQKALLGNEEIVDIHHAGTAMRFLTAYFAVNESREVVLTGSQRMTERPIKVLVEALEQLGAKITYEKEPGYPPIRIKGQKITASKVNIPANVSSQYISALLLVAPKLENGIEITLVGEITSVPYIKMTLALLNDLDIKTSFEGNVITIYPKQAVASKVMTVESDWSSASYFFSLVALAENATVSLTSYTETSLQGDSALVEIYKLMGVETHFEGNKMTLTKQGNFIPQTLNLELNNTPDIAQTIVVTCLGLGIGCHLTGLHTLKIKETDRLEALRIELTKLGASISVTNDSLTLLASSEINHNIKIATYNDHRMAMAFAPLALKVPIIIENAEVVSKSYPDFWEDLKSLGFEIS